MQIHSEMMVNRRSTVEYPFDNLKQWLYGGARFLLRLFDLRAPASGRAHGKMTDDGKGSRGLSIGRLLVLQPVAGMPKDAALRNTTTAGVMQFRTVDSSCSEVFRTPIVRLFVRLPIFVGRHHVGRYNHPSEGAGQTLQLITDVV
jgi:hypothetical protein